MITCHVNNFSEWRDNARTLLLAGVNPSNCIWTMAQADLFSTHTVDLSQKGRGVITIPVNFLELAKYIAYHRDQNKWNLLYQALWRITHGEKHLLQLQTDPLVHQLLCYQKQLRRDAHKMKAFVRFREYKGCFIAWYKPDHLITELVAPFFKKRFSVMNWTIMTPHATVSWNGMKLIFSNGCPEPKNLEDEIEKLWGTYYQAIFNPARIKLKAMYNEMPRRYWATMPETKYIPAMLQDAPRRVAEMMKHTEGLKQSARDFFLGSSTLSQLGQAVNQCKACSLYRCARNAVFGRGNSDSRVMLVGEQPGLQEDIEGKAFVGPAGKVLQEVLHEIGVNIEQIYVTNIVKHFKHEIIHHKPIHRTPSVPEVNACKPWVEKEIELIKPKVIVCLGNTAARALINPGFTMQKHRTLWRYESITLGATYHPAAILRVKDHEKQKNLRQLMKNDLQKAFSLV